MNKDLLSIKELDRADIMAILKRARYFKDALKNGDKTPTLAGRTLALIFDKSSTRTRVSFEVGIRQLGGSAIFLNRGDIQIGRGESIADTARVLSRYVDGVVIRTFSHDTVEEFALNATVPVINGLTDLLHPCQVLSDLFTIEEKRGTLDHVRVCYIGDGNNMAHSWIYAAAKLPIQLTIACPAGYEPDEAILAEGKKSASDGITLCHAPAEACDGADVLYTDVWTSMGQEEEQGKRQRAFREYQINQALLVRARADAIVMHCLPAHRGEEITADVIDGPQSVVIDQAENRLHVQKAIMDCLMGGKTSDEKD